MLKRYTDGTAIIFTKEGLFKNVHYNPQEDSYVVWNKNRQEFRVLKALTLGNKENLTLQANDKILIFHLDPAKAYRDLNWHPESRFSILHPIRTRKFLRSKKHCAVVFREGASQSEETKIHEARTNTKAYSEAEYKRANQFTVRMEAHYTGYKEWLRSLKKAARGSFSTKWIIAIMIIIAMMVAVFLIYSSNIIPGFSQIGR